MDIVRIWKQDTQYTLLVAHDKIILPSLHIKLRLMTNFVKAMHQKGEAFKYLKKTFPHLKAAKIKEGELFLAYKFVK